MSSYGPCAPPRTPPDLQSFNLSCEKTICCEKLYVFSFSQFLLFFGLYRAFLWPITWQRQALQSELEEALADATDLEQASLKKQAEQSEQLQALQTEQSQHGSYRGQKTAKTTEKLKN